MRDAPPLPMTQSPVTPRIIVPALVVLLVLAVFALVSGRLSDGQNDLLVILIGGLAVVGWAVSRWTLQRRLAWLQQAMRRAGEGELGVRLDLPEEHAWASIAEAFNATMGNLERNRAQLLLRETELQQRNAALLSLREALDSHAIVSVTATNGDILFVNDKFCRVSGYSATELLGQNHRLLKSGAHDQAFYADLWRTIRAGQAWHGVIENRRKDGGHYWVQSSILPVLDASGTPHQYISIRTDISGRERLRKGLQMLASAEQGPELFQRIAEGLTVGLDARWAGVSRLCADGSRFEVIACWDTDAPGPQFDYAVAGAPCEMALAQDAMFVVDSDVRGQFPDALALASMAVESYRGLVFSDHRGRPLGVLWVMSERPTETDPGEAALLAVAAKRAAAELTRLVAEGELREKESRLALVVEGAGLGVWDWEIASGRVHMNDRWWTMLGYAPDAIGRHIDSWRQLVHPDDSARVEAALTAHFDGRADAYAEEVRMRAHDGRWIWVLDSGRVTCRDAAGRPLRMSGIHLDITERKNAEQALSAEQSRLQLVLRAGRIGFWDWDIETDAVDVNDIVREEFGAQTAGFTRMREWFALIDPAHRQAFRQASRDCLLGLVGSFDQVARWQTDGGWKWVRTQGQVTARDAAGRARRMMGVHLDIDEQRRADERVRAHEERLRQVVASAALGTWDYDMQTGRIETNEHAARMLGYEPNTLRTQAQWIALGHEDDTPALRKATREHLEGRAPFFVAELRMRCADGSWLWMLSRGQITQRDAQGRPLRMVGIHLDINERKRAEAALIASEARFRVLVENVAIGIYLCDPAGQVIYASPAAERLFDMSAAAAALGGWAMRIHEDDMPLVLARWNALREGRASSFDAEYRLHDPRGAERRIHGQAHAVEVDGRLMGFVGSVEDVTARVADAAERDRLQNQLQQAHKMEALGQLTGGIAHDFNNILASILGYASLAHGRFAGDNPKLAEYLTAVVTAGERARDLIGKMLSFSRNAPRDDGTSMDVAALVREVATLLASVIPSGIQIQVDVAPDVPRVQLGATDLHQVLVNLAVNARDAMGESGRLDIAVAAVRCERDICATCHERVEGDFVEIVCRDTGAGMDAELLKRIFEPFFTTKEVGKGTGMGLAVVHGVVHRAGGHLLVESTPGAGTAFRILLPPASPRVDDGLSSTVALPATMPATRDGRVLVVDDEPMIASYLRELLETNGHAVTVAQDGAAALALVRATPTAFDLVVTDQTMPKLSGIGLVKALRSEYPTLPVVLCTGFSDSVNLRTARALGVRRFLRKPVEAATILRTVSELLAAPRPTQLTERSLPSQ